MMTKTRTAFANFFLEFPIMKTALRSLRLKTKFPQKGGRIMHKSISFVCVQTQGLNRFRALASALMVAFCLLAGATQAQAQVTVNRIGTTEEPGPFRSLTSPTGGSISYREVLSVDQKWGGNIVARTVFTLAQIRGYVAASINASQQNTWQQTVTATVNVPKGRQVTVRPVAIYTNYFWEYRVAGIKVATGSVRKYEGWRLLTSVR